MKKVKVTPEFPLYFLKYKIGQGGPMHCINGSLHSSFGGNNSQSQDITSSYALVHQKIIAKIPINIYVLDIYYVFYTDIINLIILYDCVEPLFWL